jgi:hypothetical protein
MMKVPMAPALIDIERQGKAHHSTFSKKKIEEAIFHNTVDLSAMTNRDDTR